MNKTLLNLTAKGFFIVLLMFCFSSEMFAQWSSDPSVNLQICDVSGDQALPKVASTSDNGCYISWFDNRNGSYAVYLQRLDQMGNKLWATNGLLVSNNPQNSSLVDYAIGTDDQNNAIVTFTDIRDNDSLHAFAYLIDSSGNFLWGANGVRLSGAGDFQANPVVTQTSDGNYVFAWIVASDTQKIALQKISPAGQKLWGANPIIYASGTAENYSNPKIVPSDNGSIILVHQGYTGPFFSAIVHLYAQKFDTNGSIVWGAGGVVIQNLGTIPFYDVPVAVSDANSGVFVAWYDDRDANSLFSSFAQHITSDGNITFPVNGAEVSTVTTMHHLDPTIAYNSSTNELYEFWMEETPLQDQFSVYGQKFDASGNRQWTNNGISFTATTSNETFGPYAQPTDTSVYVFYIQGGNAGGLNDAVDAFMVNSSGDFSWTPNIVDMSDPTQQKLHTVTTISNDQIAKVVWEDTRNDGGGIYAQNINPNGQLGNVIVPVELTSFTASVNGTDVLLNWKTATETNNKGFEVERSQGSEISSQVWENIGYVSGFGTTTEPKSYSYSDNVGSSGTYNYRLKQTDFDGSFKYFTEVEVKVNVPLQFALSQNYPNPFNPTTQIEYSVPQAGFVTLKVYNTLGQEVASLVNGMIKAGTHEVTFNGSNLTSGVYYYRIESGSKVSVKKMMLLK